MIIAYNSAYVQTDTFNFTFARPNAEYVGHDNGVTSGTHFCRCPTV